MAPGFLPRRTPREWAMRGALAAAAAVAGCFSGAHTLALVVAQERPTLAHRLAPWDGRITAALAASLTGPGAGEAQRRRSDGLARRALRQDATAVTAAATLGINAQLRGDGAAASRLFTYAEKLSRRDLQTQLWMIEAAVGRGDIPGALRHYDIALRTKRQSWDLLFPILTSASANPPVRAELVKTLAARPPWAEPFINHVAAHPADPQAASTLFLDLRRAGLALPDRVHAAAINELIGDGFADEAWRHYAAIRGGADRRQSRDPHFALASDAPTAFDWAPVSAGGIDTSIQRGAGGDVFDFAADSGMGGPLLRQMQMFPPGTYRIEGHSSGIAQPAQSLPYWTLVCQTGGREFGRVTVPNSAEAGGAFSGRFTVPADCPVQALILIARTSDEAAGLSGQIDRVQVVPAQ